MRRPETFLRMSSWPMRLSPGVGDCQDAATSHHQDPTQPHPLLTQFIVKNIFLWQSDSSVSSVSLFTYPRRQSWSMFSSYEQCQCVCILFLFILLPSSSPGRPLTPTAGYRKLIHWNISRSFKYLFSQVTSSLASLSLYMKLSLRIVKKIST